MTLPKGAVLARRHAEEIINGRHLELVEEVYAPDAVFHDPFAPDGAAHGAAAIKEYLASIIQAQPDFHFDIEDVFGTENRGIWRGTVTGTLAEPFGSVPATGKTATVPLAEVFAVRDGRIGEVWAYVDRLSVLQQFGIIAD